MELKDLVGEHTLDAVDFSTDKVLQWDAVYEGCQVCNFRLDGIVYSAVEDPGDGYRSSTQELLVLEQEPKNVFRAIKVVGSHKTETNDGGCNEAHDILQLIDVGTGEIVLEVGTANTDDYYPYYVARFSPENMITNN